MYTKIYNPITNKYVNIRSNEGRTIIRNYLNQLGGSTKNDSIETPFLDELEHELNGNDTDIFDELERELNNSNNTDIFDELERELNSSNNDLSEREFNITATKDTNELLSEIANIAFETKDNTITESFKKTLYEYIKKYSDAEWQHMIQYEDVELLGDSDGEYQKQQQWHEHQDGESIFQIQPPGSQFDMSPLSLACKTTNTKLIDLIYDSFTNYEDILNIRDKFGNNIFHMLIFYDTELNTLNYLIKKVKQTHLFEMVKLLYSENTLGYTPLDVLADGLLMNSNGIGIKTESSKKLFEKHINYDNDIKFFGVELGHKSKIAEGLNDLTKLQRRNLLMGKLIGAKNIDLFKKMKKTITINQILGMIINK